MKRATKILMVAMCVSLCVGGAIFSVKENAKDSRPKTKVVPVNNDQPHRRVWIWV